MLNESFDFFLDFVVGTWSHENKCTEKCIQYSFIFVECHMASRAVGRIQSGLANFNQASWHYCVTGQCHFMANNGLAAEEVRQG